MSLRVPRHIVCAAGLLAALLAPGSFAGRLAGTVHLETGAVSARRGRGENEVIRRGVRALRVDVGETLRTSPHVEGTFIAFEESQCPLEAETTYEVARDGLWMQVGAGRVRVLEFRVPVGKRPRPATPAALARVRGAGAPRIRGPRSLAGTLLDGDATVQANTALHAGEADTLLLALNEGGKALLRGPGSVHIQKRNLVLRRGRLVYVAGGASSVVLTPQGALVGEPGAVVDVEVRAPDEVEAFVLDGRVVADALPGRRGPRRTLPVGSRLGYDERGRPVVDGGRGGRAAVLADAVRAACANPDPRAGWEGFERHDRGAAAAPARPAPAVAGDPGASTASSVVSEWTVGSPGAMPSGSPPAPPPSAPRASKPRRRSAWEVAPRRSHGAPAPPPVAPAPARALGERPAADGGSQARLPAAPPAAPAPSSGSEIGWTVGPAKPRATPAADDPGWSVTASPAGESAPSGASTGKGSFGSAFRTPDYREEAPQVSPHPGLTLTRGRDVFSPRDSLWSTGGGGLETPALGSPR